MTHRASPRSLRASTRRFIAPLLGFLCAAGVAHADPSFTHPQFTGTVTMGFVLNSDVEWVTDEGSGSRYSPQLDQRIRVFSQPWARSASIAFTSGDLQSGDSADAIEFGWSGFSPSATETGLTMPLGTMSVPSNGSRSLMSPGLAFRFRTGAAPATATGDSEADGFRTGTLSVTAGATMGSTSTQTLLPFERALVLLTANDSIVNFALPSRLTTEGVSVAAWLEGPANGGASDVGVWMRCNALPNAANFAHRQFFATNQPVFIRPTSACNGTWFVTVGSDATSAKLVHVTASAHNTNRIVTGERIGIKFNATANQRSGIGYGFRSAAWRVYGMTEGTKILRSFSFFNNSSCSKLNGCGGAGCSVCVTQENCRSNVNTFDGYMTICNNETADLITNDKAQIDPAWAAAQVIAHEFGHQWLAQPDEYWDVGGCPGSIGLCGHTMMEIYNNNVQGLCNNANHRGHVEDRRVAGGFNRILGPIGFACNGGAGWVDAQSGWSRWTQGTPGGMMPSFSPQNLNYVRQGFAVRSDVGSATFN